MKVTEIPFLYRDANNYKAHSTIVLEGEITEEQKEAIRATLLEDDKFIPEQLGLGLVHLGFNEPTWTSFPNEDDDHPYHELGLDEAEVYEESTRPARPAEPRRWSVEEFVAKFTAIGRDGWDSVKYDVGSR